MIQTRRFRLPRSAVALALLVCPAVASAQQAAPEPSRLETFGRDVSGALGSIFGQRNGPDSASPQMVQMAPSDMLLRIDQLERQIRQLTGAVEQLQYRNQQLEQQVRRLEDEAGRGAGAASAPRRAPPRPGAIAPPAAAVVPAPPPTQAPAGRRNDAFDPSQHPNAPGAPRPLGSPGSRSEDLGHDAAVGAVASARANDGIGTTIMNDETPVGVPGGREPGAPLDLTDRPGAARPEPPAGARTAALPPQTARDEFDLAYGYMQRKEYAQAEQGLRAFLTRHPSDKLAGDAQFWLGESMFQRQRYRESADAFVAMAKKYDKHPKAPDALLRLGQSLAALKEKELACATLGEVARKYPRASHGVRQSVEREQKRAGC